jgi:acetolactate synthase-1/2/3 large subunit
MNITSGEAIVKMLKNEGVEVVFGIPDGTYWGIMSNLEKYGIKLISPRHESCGVHAAGAYSKATGKLGVCLMSNGPGVAAALSGIAVEQVEGHRVLMISSCRRPEIANPDRGGAYQVFDHIGTVGPMSKFSATIKSHDRTIETTRQCFRKLYEGRPGVVHLDVPETLCNGKFNFEEGAFLQPHQYRNTERMHPSDDAVNKAAQMLVNADFPVFHVGNGIFYSGAQEELELVANLLHMPVTTSWAARGALKECNTLAMPLVAIETNNNLRKESDLILTIGSRLGETDWWGKEPHWGNPYEQKMIQVDIDDEWIGRNKPVTLGVKADAKVFLRKVYEKLKTMEDKISVQGRKDKYNVHLSQWEKERTKLDENLEDMSSPMNTAHVPNLAKKVIGDNSIAIFDGGNAAVWGQFFYKCSGRSMGIGTPKMGMLGAGVGQALGAAAAYPDKTIYCIIGDGAMGYHPQEIETAVRNKMKIIYLVCCDKQWGMVKINQQINLKPIKTLIKKRLEADETINADFNEIRFDKVAEAMGGHGERVSSPAELEEALKRCNALDTCSVIHIDVDPAKHLWAPGLRVFKKMHDEPKGNNGQQN